MHTTDNPIYEIQKTSHRAQYTVGRLMSPEQVDQATQGYDYLTRQRLRGHWSLCGDCSQEMFDNIAQLRNVALRHSLGVFQRNDGTKFLVVTHQLGSAQHRFLVPMWDPRVPDFLDAVSSGRYSISLARKGDTRAVVLPTAADAPMAQRLRNHLHVPEQQQIQALLQTLPALIEQAAQPQRIPTLVEGQDISDVSVSIVFDALRPSLNRPLEHEAMKKRSTLH